MKSRCTLAVALGLVTLLLVGCDSATTPNADLPLEEGNVVPRVEAPLTLDEQFALMAEEIEGFGGLFIDESGRINVYLKDPSQADFAMSVLSTKFAHVLGEHVASKIGSMHTHQGRYDFLELKAWKDLSIGLMKLPGAVYYDIAESENRLRIGVEGKKEMERIQQVMTAHGIPTTAFIVEEATMPGVAYKID